MFNMGHPGLWGLRAKTTSPKILPWHGKLGPSGDRYRDPVLERETSSSHKRWEEALEFAVIPNSIQS